MKLSMILLWIWCKQVIYFCLLFRETGNLKLKPVGRNKSSARQPVKTANRLKWLSTISSLSNASQDRLRNNHILPLHFLTKRQNQKREYSETILLFSYIYRHETGTGEFCGIWISQLFSDHLILLRGNVEQYGFQYEDNTNQKHSFVELSFITD